MEGNETLVGETHSRILPGRFHQQHHHMTLPRLPPGCLPASARSGHTLLHPSLLQTLATCGGAALGRITEGHSTLTCLNTTPKEGGIYVCTARWAFCSAASTGTNLPRQLLFALLFFLTCHHTALFHLQGSFCKSSPEAVGAVSEWRGKVTEGSEPSPFGASLFRFQAGLA